MSGSELLTTSVSALMVPFQIPKKRNSHQRPMPLSASRIWISTSFLAVNSLQVVSPKYVCRTCLFCSGKCFFTKRVQCFSITSQCRSTPTPHATCGIVMSICRRSNGLSTAARLSYTGRLGRKTSEAGTMSISSSRAMRKWS